MATDEHSDAPILNFELVPSDFDEDTLEVCALGKENKLKKFKNAVIKKQILQHLQEELNYIDEDPEAEDYLMGYDDDENPEDLYSDLGQDYQVRSTA